VAEYAQKVAYSASTLLVGRLEGHLACKKHGDDGGGHCIVRMEWCPAGWLVCLPLLIFPCTIKSRSSLLAPSHPGGPGKRAIKRLYCGVVECAQKSISAYNAVGEIIAGFPRDHFVMGRGARRDLAVRLK